MERITNNFSIIIIIIVIIPVSCLASQAGIIHDPVL